MLNFKINEEKCIKCGQCVTACALRVISMNEGEFPSVSADTEERCIGCQHCYCVCPTGALSVFELNPATDSVAVDFSEFPSAESMELLVKSRRSIRNYKQENVDKNLLDKMLHLTAHAPTAVNSCGLIFDVVSDIDKMNEIREGMMAGLAAYRNESEFPPAQAYIDFTIEPWKKYKADSVFRGAPHALIISAKNDNVSSMKDIIIAMSYFELIAQVNGVGTTWCGMMKMALELLPDYREKLFSDSSVEEYYCMLFGYPNIRYTRTCVRDNAAAIRYV